MVFGVNLFLEFLLSAIHLSLRPYIDGYEYSFNSILLCVVAGIPDLPLPNLQRLHIKKLDINIGSAAITLQLLFTNITMVGFGGIKIEKIVLVTTYNEIELKINLEFYFRGFPRDPKTMSKFVVSGFVPMISAKGNYKASGKILLLPVTGTGEGEIQYCKYAEITHTLL